MAKRSVEVQLDPRPQFAPYLQRSQRWACMVVHRRAGKTFACVQDLICKALTYWRPGPPLRFAYIAPTRDQAKDIAWGYIREFVGRLPGVKLNEADLCATLANGATVRLYSGESYERLRGVYLDGVVVDEYADIDPNAWHAVLRPCLTDYRGWATFIGTPKGRNQFWRLWQAATQQQTDWFTLILRASVSGLIPPEELSAIRNSTPAHIFEQEYECSFAVGRPGAIYAQAIEAARADGRVTETVEWHAEAPVWTSWDVGAARNQKVWIWQVLGDRINYLESLTGGDDCKTPADWAGRLMGKKYRYGGHFIPHDAAAEVGGLWQEALATGGLGNVVPVPRQHSVWDGINLALDAFPRIRFNVAGCSEGLDALDAYHAREERDGVTIRDVPVHDWASHYSDAFALGHQAIRAGLVVDRSAIRHRVAPVRVVAGFRGDFGGGKPRVLR